MVRQPGWVASRTVVDEEGTPGDEPGGNDPGSLSEEAAAAGTFDVRELYHPTVDRSIRQLPRLLVGALRLVWGAARGQFILNVALLAVGSAALALQVLVGKQLLTQLLADNTTKDFSSAVPSVVLLAIVLAVASVTLIIRNEIQRLLAELVARSSMQQVVDAACRADLARFEDPAFHDRLQRAIVNASIRPLQMTNGLLAVGTSVTGVVAVGVVLLLIDPLFFVLGLLAGIPITLASLRVGRALYRFAVEQTPTDRERTYIQGLLVEKDPAKEIRAYEMGWFLRRPVRRPLRAADPGPAPSRPPAGRSGRARRGPYGHRFRGSPGATDLLRVRRECLPRWCRGRGRRPHPARNPAPGPSRRGRPVVRERPFHPGLQQFRTGGTGPRDQPVHRYGTAPPISAS